MARTVRLVVSLPVYAAVAVLGTLATLSLFVVSQNLDLVSNVVLGGSLPLASRLVVYTSLYPFVGPDYTVATATVLTATAVAVGANVAVLVYHLREHRLAAPESAGSVGAVVLGTLGAGCAACGSAVLAGVLSLVGVSASLTVLPLDGLEFALLALVVAVLATHWLADGMRGGEIGGCPVDVGRN
jgi:hypothetical protein